MSTPSADGAAGSAAKPCAEGGRCADAEQHVWDYLDGEMGSKDCARISEHVASCPPCEAMFKNEKKLKDAVSRACGCEEAPQDLRGRIATRLAQLRAEHCGSAD